LILSSGPSLVYGLAANADLHRLVSLRANSETEIYTATVAKTGDGRNYKLDTKVRWLRRPLLMFKPEHEKEGNDTEQDCRPILVANQPTYNF
jgi:hypothetical protein